MNEDKPGDLSSQYFSQNSNTGHTVIAMPLKSLLYESFATSIQLRTVQGVPICNTLDRSNHRPVSVLHAISNLFERAIYE